MSRKKAKKKGIFTREERSLVVQYRERCLALGAKLVDLVMGCYVGASPFHDNPLWKGIKDFGVESWAAIVDAMLRAGWKPPEGWEQ